MTAPAPTWFDLGSDHGVLELEESCTFPGPALELHVVVTTRGVTVAWWETDTGHSLRRVEVGVA